MAAGAILYLKKIGILGGELFLGFLQAGEKCGALDADDLSDSFVGQTFLPELTDLQGLWHQCIQTLKKLVQFGLVADDRFNGRHRVLQYIQRRADIAVIILIRVIKGKHITGATEFAVVTVAVAKPELILGADTPTMRLVALAESVVVASMVSIIILGNLHPFACGFEIDTIGIDIFLHFNFLHSICMEWRKPRCQLPNGNTNPTAVFVELPPFRSAASRSIGSCLCSLLPSYTVEPPLIRRRNI